MCWGEVGDGWRNGARPEALAQEEGGSGAGVGGSWGCTSTPEIEAAVPCVLLASGDQAAQKEEAAARGAEFRVDDLVGCQGRWEFPVGEWRRVSLCRDPPLFPGRLHIFILFSSQRHNLYLVRCKSLKGTAQWVFTSVHTCVATTQIEI